MQIPETMNAVVLRGRGSQSLTIDSIPVPKPGPKQILARVDAAGICTSLIKTIDQGHDHPYFYGRDLRRFPAILGDEGSVTIVKVGSQINGKFTVGKRYVIQPAIDHSPVNNLNQYTNKGVGVTKIACGYTLPGHLAEYILVPEEVLLADCIIPLPNDNICYAHAAIAEPLSCCISGQQHHIHLIQDKLTKRRGTNNGLKSGGLTVIVGLGAMGRMHVEAALTSDIGQIIASDPLQNRRDKSKKLFAERAVKNKINLIITDPKQLSDEVNKVSGGNGADDLIIAVGVASVIEASIPLLGKGGFANLFGGLKSGSENITINANLIHYGETCISGSSGGTAWDIFQALNLMARGNINAAPHIAKIGGMSHALDLIDDVRCQRLDGKAILYPHRPLEQSFEVDSWTSSDELEYLR